MYHSNDSQNKVSLIPFYRSLLNKGIIQQDGYAHNRLKKLVLNKFEQKRKKSIK